jgi:cell division protein FtsB
MNLFTRLALIGKAVWFAPETLAALAADQRDVTAKLDRHEGLLLNADQALEGLAADLKQVESDAIDENRVEELVDKRCDDVQENLDDLERRLDREEREFAQQGDLDDVEADVEDHESRVAKLEEKVERLEGEVQTLRDLARHTFAHVAIGGQAFRITGAAEMKFETVRDYVLGLGFQVEELEAAPVLRDESAEPDTTVADVRALKALLPVLPPVRVPGGAEVRFPSVVNEDQVRAACVQLGLTWIPVSLSGGGQ